MANINTLGYVHSETLVKWVMVFICLQAIAAVVGMVSGYMDYSWLQDYANGAFSSEAVAKSSAEFNDFFKVLIFGCRPLSISFPLWMASHEPVNKS